MITNSLGKEINVFDLKPEDLCMEDVITALPHICRYGGRCKIHYSVAQHCVELAIYLLEEMNRPDLARMAIMHDACEAYLGDINYPLKIEIPEFMQLEEDVTNLFYKVYDIDMSVKEEFFEYDRNISVNEMKALGLYETNKTRKTVQHLIELPNLKIVPMNIKESRMLFVRMLKILNVYEC